MERDETEIAERRTSQRRATRSPVRVGIETRTLEGIADNISQTGVLFFSDDQVRVTVELDDNGRTLHRTGRLVRAQRIEGERTGWAVEFDEA
jgi:PilZ domain